MIKKIFKIAALIFISIFLIAACFFTITFLYYHDFDNSSVVVLATPHGPVRITLDRYQIPHIESSANDEAVLYGLGYIHAKHRLWQMELQRHVVAGRLSEIFGGNTLEYDRYLRTWGFYRAAKKDWNSFDDKTKKMIISYTEGVNGYIKKNKLPLEMILLHHKPRRWTVSDSYSFQKMLAWQLQNSWKTKLNNYLMSREYGDEMVGKLEVNYPSYGPVVLKTQESAKNKSMETYNYRKYLSNSTNSYINTYLAFKLLNVSNKLEAHLNIKNLPGKGSNNWVVSGALTSTGKPFLANDVHLELTSPSMWYLAKLTGPNLHVQGATIPGVFCVIIGHNDNIAWGMTDAGLDVQDIYHAEQRELITQDIEIIKVRWHKDEKVIIKSFHGNPIISEITNSTPKIIDVLSIRWPALMGNDTTAQSLLKINYAANWRDFTEALRDYVSPSQNFLYADIHNNIGYYLPGRIPIRDKINYRYPVFHYSRFEWRGYIPFEKLPHSYNPPEGFIASANNKIVGNDYPYKLTSTWKGDPYRIIRIEEMLKQKKRYSLNDMERMQSDSQCALWKYLKHYLLNTTPLDKESEEALEVLKEWDGNVAGDSSGATIFSAWFNELTKMQPSLPVEYSNYPKPVFIIEQLNKKSNFCRTLNAKNCDEFLSITLRNITKMLSASLGNDPTRWKWRRIHKAIFDSTMFGKIPIVGQIWHREIETEGGPYTINVGTYDLSLKQVAGATYRQVIDLSDTQNSEYIYPMGQSENPFSIHYDEFLTMWQKGHYIRY